MPRKPSDLETVLQRKFGFAPAREHSSDHRWYELRLPGLPPILTKVSHGRKEITAKLEGKIARQLRVRGPYLQEMLDCSHSREEYYQKLRDDPFPPFDIRF